MNQNQNLDTRQTAQIRPVSHQLSPQEDNSERNLSNDLRELAELDNKSGLITQNLQNTQQNTSKVEKQSFNNTALAKSQLIQLPIQQFVQQEHLRLSSPIFKNQNQQQQIFISNNRSPQNIQVVHQPNQILRSTLPPPNSSSNKIASVSNQYSTTWITQPATTQARVQSNYQSFNNPILVQSYTNQVQTRRVNYLQPLQQNQHRPNSVSPKKITFNYQSNQRNPSPSIPNAQSQQIIHKVPQNNALNVIIQPPSHPQIIPNIPPQQGQLVIWQQRYFIIFSKFQYYYQRLQLIHKKYLYLDKAIGQTKPEQLKLLKAESQELLLLITTTEQQLTETIHRNRQILSEATNWKQKYQELSKAFQNLKQSHIAINQELLSKVDLLDKQLAQLQNNYHDIIKKNEDQTNKNKQLQQQLVTLNEQLKSIQTTTSSDNHKQFQLQLSQLSKIVEQKNDIIQKLKKRIELKENNTSNQQHMENHIENLDEEITQYKNLISQLKLQNDRLHSNLKEKTKESQQTKQRSDQKIKRLQANLAQYELRLRDKDNEVKKYLSLLQSKNNAQNSSTSKYSNQKQYRSSQFQIQNRRLKHQLTIYQQSHSSDLKMFNAKIQELVDKIKMMSVQRDSTVGNLQEKTILLQSDLNKKDGTIRNLRDRILELQQQKRIKQLDRKYQPKKQDDTIHQNKQIHHLKKQMNDKINQIEQLQNQLSQYKRLYNQQEDSLQTKKHEIKNLKRQLQEKQEGLQNSSQLNDVLVKKNDQLIQANNRIAELEKIRNQNEALRQENSNLNESLRKKHVELSESSDRAYLLQKKIRELELLSDNSPKLAHLTQEYELLQNAISKKDQQIVKLRQNNQLLQSNINELQIDLQKVKNRFNSGEKNSQNERGELKSKLSVLQLKTIEYQRKIIGLQEVRVIMAQQINTLTSQIHIKFQNLQRSQVQLKQERARSKAYQNQIAQYLTQIEEAKVKVKDWQKKYQLLNKQLQGEKQKKKDLSNTKKNELYNLNNRCIQLQNSCKVKDARIKQLQKNVDTLSSKIRNLDHNLQEIQYLKHKISEYEQKITYQNNRFTTSSRLPDLEPTQIFQRKVIYQLKIQNENLRKQLGLAPKPQGKESNIPERDFNPNVNQRLNDFNKKLQEIISQNVTVDYNLNGDQLYRKFQRDRRLLIQRHNEEITQLKVKILQLQGQTFKFPTKKYNNFNQIFNEQLDFYKQKNNQLEQRVQNHIRVNKQLKESLQFLLKSQNGDHSIIYYKQQLEKSSDAIVNLQKQLKKTNQQLKKLKEDAIKANSSQHIDTNIEAQSKIIELTRKINQLTLQINLLQKDRVNKQQSIHKHESEAKRLRIINQELKSSKDQLQRLIKDKEIAYQDEISKVTNKLRINQSEVQRLNQLLSKRQDQDSNQLKNLRGRLADLQEESKKYKTSAEDLTIAQERYKREISKLENQIQILIAETQRLKQISEGAGKRHRQTDVQVQSLQTLVSDYQGKIKGLQSIKQSYNYRENQLQQELGRLSNQVRLFQAQIQRMTEFTQKKVAEKDSEINRLKIISNERIDEITRLQDQIRELKLFSFKSNESAQEIFNLKQEINGLRISYNLKNTQCENRLREIYELNDRLRYMEEQSLQIKKLNQSKNNQLQLVINSLQSQLADSRKIKDNSSSEMSIRVQTLEEQLRSLKYQKEQQIVSLTSKISYYQLQIKQVKVSYQAQVNGLKQTYLFLQQRKDQFQVNYNSLHAHYELIVTELQQLKLYVRTREQIIKELQFQISYLQNELNSSQRYKGGNHQQALISNKYSLQLLRSALIEIQALIKEQVGVRVQAMQKIERQIQLGLQQCRIMNQNLDL